MSVYDVGDRMKEVTDYARSVGVSVAGVSDKVVGNLGKMNLYNFDNGIKGLAKMVLGLMKQEWLADAQATKIREQEEYINRLVKAGIVCLIP